MVTSARCHDIIGRRAFGRWACEFEDLEAAGLGAEAVDLTQLVTVWKHANISRAHKVCIFNACVVQKLFVLFAHSAP